MLKGSECQNTIVVLLNTILN